MIRQFNPGGEDNALSGLSPELPESKSDLQMSNVNRDATRFREKLASFDVEDFIATEDLKGLSEFIRTLLQQVRQQCEFVQPLSEPEANEASKIQEERYRLVLEGLNEGIWDWDIRQDKTYWNERLYNMLELPQSSSAPTGQHFIQLIHPEDRKRFAESLDAHLQKDAQYEVEMQMKQASGQYAYYSSRGKAIRDAQGTPIRMTGMLFDISERKKREISLREEKQAAEISVRKRDTFLANMSHEFRTPLNAIIGFSEMMAKGYGGSLSTKQSKYIQNVLVSSKHLLKMANDILDISKTNVEKISLFPQQLEILPIIEDVKSVFAELAMRDKIRLLFELSPDVHFIYADPIRLRQILFNLIMNAIKFNKPEGKVIIRFRSGADDVVICEVEDTGVGIAPEKRSDIFLPFFQIDTQQTGRLEGTGLGLAITKSLVELHGGTIHVESQEGVGSKFMIQLPMKP